MIPTTPPGYVGCRVSYRDDGNFLIYLKPNKNGEVQCIHVKWDIATNPKNDTDRIIAKVIRDNYKLPWPNKPEDNMTGVQLSPAEITRAVIKHAASILQKFDRPISTTYFELELQDLLQLSERPHIRTQLHRAADKRLIKRHAYEDKKGYFWSSTNVADGTPPASMKFRKSGSHTQSSTADDDDELDDDLSMGDTIENADSEDDQKPQETKSDPQLERRVTALESGTRLHSASISEAQITINELKQQIAELNRVRKVEFTVVQPDKTKVTIKEDTHEAFEQVLWHLTVGDNVMLVGPKGSGKTTLCEQLAKALKRDWNFISMSGGTTETKLYGKSTPNITNGKLEYHRPEFVRLYEEGGLYLIDEVDAGDPNVLLSLNNPLENKWMSVERAKNPKIKMNPKFICMSAANTWGHGADRQYVGRNQLDGAFVERWTQIDMDYDKNLEFKLCAKIAPGKEEWVEKLHRFRSAVRLNKLEREISTRWICRTLRWLKAGKDEEYCETMLFKGWRESEIRQVKGASNGI